MGASSLDLPDLEQAEMDASVSGSPQPQRKTGLSVLRMLLDFMGHRAVVPGTRWGRSLCSTLLNSCSYSFWEMWVPDPLGDVGFGSGFLLRAGISWG